MNEQILSFIRTLVRSGAPALAAKGLNDQQVEMVLVVIVMWLIPTACRLWVRRKAGLVASAAKTLPPDGMIATTPDIASKIDDPKVVSTARR